jgi:hypothetical protein
MKGNQGTMKRCRIVILSLVSIYATLWSEPHLKAGTNLFTFLTLGYDARTMAMGNTGAGLANDIYGTLCNPAALGYTQGMQAMVTFQPILLDVKTGAIGYARPTASAGVWAVSLKYLSEGEVAGVDEYNLSTGITYSPYSLAAAVSWARPIVQDMQIGATVKGIYRNAGSSDAGTATGIAVDIGWQYRMLESRLVYGVMVSNLGFVLKGYSEVYDQSAIPFSIRAGLSYNPLNIRALLLALDLEKASDDYLNYRLGAEIAAFRQILFIRGGLTVSQEDISEKMKDWFNIGITDSKSYIKSNWNLFSLGVGIAAPISALKVKVDAACNFRTDWLPPSVSLGLLAEF